MVQKDLNEAINILKNNLEVFSEKYDIQLIYIFGSYAKGKNNKNSDLDIAVLLKKDYNPLDKLSLIGDFIDTFKRDDIDLVILNTANPVLEHQVIKHGKLVYMKDEDIKITYEVRVLKEYMDMEYFRNTQMEYIRQWAEKQ
jgi:predicted nucleotidyltransferase